MRCGDERWRMMGRRGRWWRRRGPGWWIGMSDGGGDGGGEGGGTGVAVVVVVDNDDVGRLSQRKRRY